MAGEDIRYGVIGTGMMGVEHINNLLAIDGVRVTAIAEPTEQSLDWAHNAVGIDAPIARFSGHGELIDSGECDAVVIASPNHTHREVLGDVLSSELHVMDEKPLCTTVADCREVVTQAADGPPGRVVWMGLEYRYMPPTQRLLAQVRGGTVGNVRMVAIREHRFPFLHKVGNWNRLTRNTGGTLVEKCCHYFDLMNLVVGTRPQGVIASGGQHVVTDDRVQFQGFHHGSSYLEHIDFRDAIRAAKPAAVTLEDGLWAVAVGEAGHRSIEERRWVELAELVG